MKKQNHPPVAQNQEAEAPENKGRKVANIIINTVLVFAIVLAALCTYVSFVSTSALHCSIKKRTFLISPFSAALHKLYVKNA